MGLPIILASASPRRMELLKQVGVEAKVIVSDIKEQIDPGIKAEELVQKLALGKAKAVGNVVSRGLIIGADTVVVKEEKILGKPRDYNDAVAMLQLLNGTEHSVITGLALVEQPSGKTITDYEKTKVFFRLLSQEEINAYVSSGEPFDKAGGYGIQEKGALLVDRIVGDYFNVVGLPLQRLNYMMKTWNINLLLF
ncbi:MAG: Maf family protein [Bacillota bacterium]|jgi:septum formation protein